MIRLLLITLVTVLFAHPALAQERTTFEGQGSWVETMQGSEGPLACNLIGENGRWAGNFVGVYLGNDFSYAVEFTGPPDNLAGEAIISGILYKWTGAIVDDVFTGRFASYAGDPPKQTRDGTFRIPRRGEE